MRAEAAYRALRPGAAAAPSSEPVAAEVREARATYFRVARRFVLSLCGANVLGGVLVFVLSAYVVPGPHIADDAAVHHANLIAFLVTLAAALPAGALLSARLARRSSEWLRAGRRPTQAELTATVAYPKRQTAVEAAVWACGLVAFPALNATYSSTLAVESAIEILLGGLTTCALTYLLGERLSRPVLALAFERAGGVRPAAHCPGVRSRLTFAWLFGAAVPLVGVLLVGVSALAGVRASVERIGLAVVVLGAVGVLVGAVVIVTAARTVAEPLISLRAALARVERGDLGASVAVDDASEIGRLQSGFNRMVGGLRERDRLLDLFGRQVGEEVAREALERDGVELGGEVRDAAVLFVDLIGSTQLAARLEPHDVVSELNAFFAIVVNCVSLHGGWVNKFEGDAALCVFGAPTSHPDAAGAALATARVLRSRLDAELPTVRAAIGVSAGRVVAGNVGAAERYEYTVIGDAVNEAARLTDLAKRNQSRLLASEEIVRRAGGHEDGRWQLGEQFLLRGRSRATRVAAPT